MKRNRRRVVTWALALGASLSSLSWSALADAAPATAECKAVFAASEKLLTTPHHDYQTQVGPLTQGKPRQSELIFDGNAFYVLVTGRWKKSPMTVQGRREQEEENRKDAKNESCHYLGDEAVGGQGAAVYTAHAESDVGTSDTKMWIAKGSGLLLKQEESVGGGDSSQAEHFSIRYDYADVHAPAAR